MSCTGMCLCENLRHRALSLLYPDVTEHIKFRILFKLMDMVGIPPHDRPVACNQLQTARGLLLTAGHHRVICES